MSMTGYDPGRLAGLRSRALGAVESLSAIRSEDPAAAGAMAAVAAARRNLEDGVLALIGRITARDPMGSWIAAGVAGTPSGWRAMAAGADAGPRNCSQPQPALCENSPVRSWFGPGYEVFGGRVTHVEWLKIEGFDGHTIDVRRSDAEWEGMEGIPIVEHTLISGVATYSVRLLDGDPTPEVRPATTATRTFYRELPLTDLESADED